MSIKNSIVNIYKEQKGEKIFKKEAPYEKFFFIKLGLIFSMPLLRLICKSKFIFNPKILSTIGLFSNIFGAISFALNQLIIGAIFYF